MPILTDGRDPRLEIGAHDLDAAEAALHAAGFTPARQARDGGAAVLELREPRAIDGPDEIARLLVAAGVPPTRLASARETLEDHFIRLTSAADRAVA